MFPFLERDGGNNFKFEARKKIEQVINPGKYFIREFSEERGSTKQTDRGRTKCQTDTNESVTIDKTSSLQEATDIDTWVYPLVQMGQLGITVDEYVTRGLLHSAESGDEILLASGYFNLTDHYMQVILMESQAKYNILMASPEVGELCVDQGSHLPLPLFWGVGVGVES